MTRLFSGAIAQLSAFLSAFLHGLQAQRFLAVVLVGFLFLTTNVSPEKVSKAVTQRVNDVVHQNDSDRPKTTGEWNREARQTEGKPSERGERIAKESGEALKEFGELYPNTAERSARGLED